MKKSILLTIFIASKLALISQDENSSYLNAGIGFSQYGTPIQLSYEKTILENISIGAGVEYNSYKYLSSSNNWTFIYGGARTSYHFNNMFNMNNEKLDLYLGGTLGYWYTSYGGYSYLGSEYGNKLYYAGHIGARYFLTEKIGAFVEGGGGLINQVKFGLTAKF